MGNTTGISWTDRTANPIKVKGSKTFHCVKKSPACDNCYAEVMAKRLAGMGGTKFYPYKVLRDMPELELNRKMLDSWAKTKKSYRNFVTSMTDMFGEFVPEYWIFEILDAMVAAPNQIFQCLTKRSYRMYNIVDKYCEKRGISSLPANIWLGITVESQKYYDANIGSLIQSKAKVKWLSMEPLLGPVNLGLSVNSKYEWINWVVVGGESGFPAKARPAHPNWFRSLRDQCKEYKIPFFFKQWGNYYPASAGGNVEKGNWKFGWERSVRYPDMPPFVAKGYGLADSHCVWMKYMPKKQAGELLDGVEHKEFPESNYQNAQ